TEGVLVPVLCRKHRGSQLRVVPQHSLNPLCRPRSQLVNCGATLREPARYVLGGGRVHDLYNPQQFVGRRTV
ncbi:hypothetical protein AB0B51_21150, partial [Streptomyces griseus]|uniref:hypothetical protein n=1 Tax=Streptomyces griseus TaxID=1911 RepID=UPI0033CFF77C